jgi:hypothetical protein
MNVSSAGRDPCTFIKYRANADTRGAFSRDIMAALRKNPLPRDTPGYLSAVTSKITFPHRSRFLRLLTVNVTQSLRILILIGKNRDVSSISHLSDSKLTQ